MSNQNYEDEEKYRVAYSKIEGLFEDTPPIEEGLQDIPFVSYKHYNQE